MIWDRQSTVMILAIALIGAMLSGCETDPVKFSEWQPISEQESLIAFIPSTEEKIPSITRRERHHILATEEHWYWKNGELFLGNLAPGRYYQQSFRTPDELKSFAQEWRRLKRMGLTVEDRDIEFGVGSLGRFIYSLSNSSDGSRTCFVFMQALRDASGGDSPGGGDIPSGGYISGYHCAGNDKTTKGKLGSTMLRYLQALELRE